MANAEDFYASIEGKMARMQKELPAMTTGFGTFFSKVMKDGAISLREKELTALAIAVAVNCQSCIRLHVQKCISAGADRAQILEAVSVSVVMGGGPAYTHVMEVIEALDALES